MIFYFLFIYLLTTTRKYFLGYVFFNENARSVNHGCILV
jgi:hypothetical protein